ncbi:unnamed protein product [Effrenium voratum]|nr:unnamed protein product [Effrenium voratum]
MDTVDYSLANLRKEQRREYELSDPDAIKKYVLPDPEDPALGPSSMLKFPSHGKDNPELKKQGQEAQAGWLAAQVQDKLDQAAHEKQLDRIHDERAMLAAHVRGVCEDNEMQEQLDAKREEAAENLRLAQLAAEQRQAKKAADDALKQKHIESVMTSDRMCEGTDSKVGVTGKLLKAEYKRLSLEEEQDVYNSNARLLIDKFIKKKADKEEEAAEASRVRCSVAVLGALEDERYRQQQERRMRMVEENKRLAQAKKESDKEERVEYFKYDPLAAADRFDFVSLPLAAPEGQGIGCDFQPSVESCFSLEGEQWRTVVVGRVSSLDLDAPSFDDAEALELALSSHSKSPAIWMDRGNAPKELDKGAREQAGWDTPELSSGPHLRGSVVVVCLLLWLAARFWIPQASMIPFVMLCTASTSALWCTPEGIVVSLGPIPLCLFRKRIPYRDVASVHVLRGRLPVSKGLRSRVMTCRSQEKTLHACRRAFPPFCNVFDSRCRG